MATERLGMSGGEQNGDHAPHRMADEDDLSQRKLLHNFRQIGGVERISIGRGLHPLAVAMAA